MVIKFRKLAMLSILFPLGLGIGLSSGEVNALSMPTKEAVSYANSEDLNDHTHSDEWIPLEQSDFNTGGTYDSGVLTGGSIESETKCYYLNDNVTLSNENVIISNYVTLCLNGRTLKVTSGYSAIVVDNYASLILCDCSSDDSGTITTAMQVTTEGGGVCIYNGSFTMYGGTITENLTRHMGGGVYVDNGSFTMYGGTITENTTYNFGGGVFVRNGTFSMYGGMITGNTALTDGDGVYVESNFNMYGGYFGDDVYKYFDNSSISITGGYLSTTSYNSIKDNDYIPTGYIAKEIEDDTWKYIVVASSHSDIINGQTIEFDTYLDEVTYKNSTSLTLSEGKYYLATDLNLDVTISGTVYLCLNGKTLEGIGNNSVIRLAESSYFNLCDCSENGSGTIKGGYTSSGFGGGMYIYGGSTFNMYGGTISNNEARTGGGVYVYFSTFNMYDGTISGNTAILGGGVCLYNSVFNMYDGTISNNNATDGAGGVLCQENSTFNMNNGTISSNSTSTGVGGVWIYNASFDMYDGTISGNTANNGAGGVIVESNGTFNMHGGTISDNKSSENVGGVWIYNASFDMYDGTISDNTSTNGAGGVLVESNGTFNMHGGYFGNDMYRDSGTISIKGGYFSSSIYDDIKSYIDNDSIGLDISTLGKEFDNNYLEEYPYAVYYAKEYSVEDVTVTYGTTYTPIVSDAYTNAIYSWVDVNDDNNTGTGLPTEVGEYTVTAQFLYTTTNDDITTKYYGMAEFKVTITSSVTETPEEGEDESEETGEEGESGESDNISDGNSDNNTIDGDTTTTNDDSSGLSAETIAGIVIGSVLVIGAIAFLVYFFIFRKRNKKGNK